MVDRAPDYSMYSRDELYEALNKLDASTYPDREASIRKYLAEREELFLPEDYTVKKLEKLRKANLSARSRKERKSVWKQLQKEGSTGIFFKELELEKKIRAELDKRKVDADYANRGKSSWQIMKVNKKLIGIGLAVLVLLGVLIFLQPKRVPGDSPAVQDALFLAQRSTAAQKLIGDSLLLEGIITGDLNVEEHGPWFKTGDANLAIPVKGDSGTGQILVKGSLQKNAWNFTRLELQPTGSDSTISLLGELMQTAGIETATEDTLKKQ